MSAHRRSDSRVPKGDRPGRNAGQIKGATPLYGPAATAIKVRPWALSNNSGLSDDA